MRPADGGGAAVSVVLSDSGLLVPAPRPVAIWIWWWSWCGRFQHNGVFLFFPSVWLVILPAGRRGLRLDAAEA